MTHFASFTAAAQLHFGIVTDAGALDERAFPQFSSLQDVVVSGVKGFGQGSGGARIDFKLDEIHELPVAHPENYLRWCEFSRSKCGIQRRVEAPPNMSLFPRFRVALHPQTRC